MHRNRKRLKLWPPPELTEVQILAWADQFHALKGDWPTRKNGVVQSAPAERWSAINSALQKGSRGLPGGSSLPRLLAAERHVRNRKGLPHLTVPHILQWSDAFYKRTGTWPHHKTTPRVIPGTRGDTWHGIDDALRRGLRGLPGKSSLARVLAEHRGVRNTGDLPPLTVQDILTWADAFRERTGEWPKHKHWQEPIPEASGETWGNVIQAILLGLRGLPKGTTLFDLLAEHRGVRNVGNLPRLTVAQILTWADAYFATHGKWPTCRCPEQTIPDTGGERWFNLDQVLRMGFRGLRGGSSLLKLLAKHRGAPNLKASMNQRSGP